MSKKYKISLSIEKRIILHLSNYNRYRTKLIVTNEVSQQGISNAAGIRLEHVSRAIKKLIQDDFIYMRNTRILEADRIKKAYFLTKNGKQYALRIKEWFRNKKILIRTLNGELREIRFSKLKDFINAKIQPLEIYNIAARFKDNIVDLKKINSIK